MTHHFFNFTRFCFCTFIREFLFVVFGRVKLFIDHSLSDNFYETKHKHIFIINEKIQMTFCIFKYIYKLCQLTNNYMISKFYFKIESWV